MDALKGFAILLVVLGHTIVYAVSDYFVPVYDLKNITVAFVYTFHMPLFIFVSGFVIYGKRISVGGKFLRLVVPFLAWLPVYYLFKGFDGDFQGSFLGFSKDVLLHPQQGLWYLLFLFLCYLCLIPVTFLERRREYLGEASLAILITVFTLVPLNVLGFLHLRNFFAFFALGYLVAKHQKWFERIKPRIVNALLLGATVLFLLLFALFYKELNHFYIWTSIREVVALPRQFLAHYGMALLGVLASYGFIRLLRDSVAYRSFCWFGLVTMDLYVAHNLMLRLSFGTGRVRIVTAFLAGVFFSLALSFLVLRRSRILSALFLGTKWAKGGPTRVS